MGEIFTIFKENYMMLEQYIFLVFMYIVLKTFKGNSKEIKTFYCKGQVLIEISHIIILILIAIIDTIVQEYSIFMNLSFFRWGLTLQTLFEIQKIILILPKTKVTILINKGVHRLVDTLINKEKK